jgi:hypothetical protein
MLCSRGRCSVGCLFADGLPTPPARQLYCYCRVQFLQTKSLSRFLRKTCADKTSACFPLFPSYFVHSRHLALHKRKCRPLSPLRYRKIDDRNGRRTSQVRGLTLWGPNSTVLYSTEPYSPFPSQTGADGAPRARTSSTLGRRMDDAAFPPRTSRSCSSTREASSREQGAVKQGAAANVA